MVGCVGCPAGTDRAAGVPEVTVPVNLHAVSAAEATIKRWKARSLRIDEVGDFARLLNEVGAKRFRLRYKIPKCRLKAALAGEANIPVTWMHRLRAMVDA